MRKSLLVLIVFLVAIILTALMITTTDVHGAEPIPTSETGYPDPYGYPPPYKGYPTPIYEGYPALYGYPAPLLSDPTIETKTIFSTPEPIIDFSEKINSSFSSINQKLNDLIKVIKRGFYFKFYIQ